MSLVSFRLKDPEAFKALGLVFSSEGNVEKETDCLGISSGLNPLVFGLSEGVLPSVSYVHLLAVEHFPALFYAVR